MQTRPRSRARLGRSHARSGTGTIQGSATSSFAVLIAFMLLPLACRNVGSPEDQLPISAHTAIEGRALRATGAPLESVSVTVKEVQGRYSLTFDPAVTDARGVFSLRVNRIGDPPDSLLPTPDTITIAVVGAYLASPEPAPRDSVAVWVRFVSPKDDAPVATTTLHLDVP